MHKSTRQAMGHGWTLQRRCALCAQLTMLAVAVLCADDAPRQSAPAHAVTSAASADTVAPCPAGKFLRLHPEPAMCAHCPIGRTSQPGARHCQKQHSFILAMASRGVKDGEQARGIPQLSAPLATGSSGADLTSRDMHNGRSPENHLPQSFILGTLPPSPSPPSPPTRQPTRTPSPAPAPPAVPAAAPTLTPTSLPTPWPVPLPTPLPPTDAPTPMPTIRAERAVHSGARGVMPSSRSSPLHITALAPPTLAPSPSPTPAPTLMPTPSAVAIAAATAAARRKVLARLRAQRRKQSFAAAVELRRKHPSWSPARVAKELRQEMDQPRGVVALQGAGGGISITAAPTVLATTVLPSITHLQAAATVAQRQAAEARAKVNNLDATALLAARAHPQNALPQPMRSARQHLSSEASGKQDAARLFRLQSRAQSASTAFPPPETPSLASQMQKLQQALRAARAAAARANGVAAAATEAEAKALAKQHHSPSVPGHSYQSTTTPAVTARPILSSSKTLVASRVRVEPFIPTPALIHTTMMRLQKHSSASVHGLALERLRLSLRQRVMQAVLQQMLATRLNTLHIGLGHDKSTRRWMSHCPAGRFALAPAQYPRALGSHELALYRSNTATANATAAAVPTARPTVHLCCNCPAGKYQPYAQKDRCFPCAAGRFGTSTGSEGSALCYSCPPGKFQRRAGSSFCLRPGHNRSSMQLRPLPGHGQRKSLTTAELLRQMAERVMNSVGDHIAGIKRTTTPAAMTPTTIAPFNASSEYAQAHFAHAARVLDRSHNRTAVPTSAPTAEVTRRRPPRDCAPGKFVIFLAQRGTRAGVNAQRSNTASCAPCPLGQFQDQRGEAYCNACGKGQSAPLAGSAYCAACDAGRFAAKEGASHCSSCPGGKYSTHNSESKSDGARGPTFCTPCSAGTYWVWVGGARCTPCSAGKFSNATAARSGSPCSSCPAGRFAGRGATSCDACPTGYGTPPQGGAAACSICPTGRYMHQHTNGGGGVCADCFALPSCPLGTQRRGCGDGAGEGQGHCVKCPVGQFGALHKVNIQANVGPGQRPQGISHLATVDEDFRDGDADADESDSLPTSPLPPLRVRRRLRATSVSSCRSCPRGKWQPYVGMAYCVATLAPTPAPTSTPTRAPTAAPTPSPSATPTAVPTQRPTPGPTPPTPRPTPRPTPAPTATPAPTPPTPLPTPPTPSPTHTPTPPPTPPTRAPTSAPTRGPTATPTATPTPAPTPPPTPWPTPAPIKCPAGMYASLASGFCLACPRGKFGVGGTNIWDCEVCPAGRYGFGGSTSSDCSGKCPAGRYGVGGSFSAVCDGACPKGRFGLVGSASPSCDGPCPSGRYGVGASTSSKCDGACPNGRYSNAGSSTCSLRTGVDFDPKGYYPGTFTRAAASAKSRKGASEWSTNSPQFHGNIGCTAGLGRVGIDKHSDTNVSTASHLSVVPPCTICPAGRWSAQGSAACIRCPPGRYGLGASTAATCDGVCPAGRYGIGGSTNAHCTAACPLGRFGFQGAAHPQCSGPCPAGRYGHGGSDSNACSGECLPGTFSATGAVKCHNCPAGKFSKRGAATCPACPAGQHPNRGIAAHGCVPCVSGRYLRRTPAGGNLANGLLECEACPVGRYRALPGGDHCDACTPGHYQPLPGMHRCRLCPMGRSSASKDRFGIMFGTNVTGAVACMLVTSSPTPPPTPAPSPSPTPAPPTPVPSAAPTRHPTPVPTSPPTRSPTPLPTAMPTPAPPTPPTPHLADPDAPPTPPTPPPPSPAPTPSPTPTLCPCSEVFADLALTGTAGHALSMVDVTRAEQIAIITSVATVAGLPDSSVQLQGVHSRSESVVLRLSLVVSTRWAPAVVSLLRAPTFVSSTDAQLRRNKPRVAAALGRRPFELVQLRTVALGPDGRARPASAGAEMKQQGSRSTVTTRGSKQSPERTRAQGDMRNKRQDEGRALQILPRWGLSQWLSAGCLVLGAYIIAQLYWQRQHRALHSSPYRLAHRQGGGANDAHAYGSFFLQPTSRYLPHPGAVVAGAVMGQPGPDSRGMYSPSPLQQHMGPNLGQGLAVGLAGRPKPEAEIELLQQRQAAVTRPARRREHTRDSQRSRGRGIAGARSHRQPQPRMGKSQHRDAGANDKHATAADIEPQNEL